MTFAAVPLSIRILASAVNGAHPASDGAHRLGWWLADHGRDLDRAAEQVARACGASPAWLERVVCGEVEPGEPERDAIALATRGAVLCFDWDMGGPLHWEDRPRFRAVPAHA